ncbi:MAG: hypothetical protein WD045_15940 [Pirellulaceae bacterium]
MRYRPSFLLLFTVGALLNNSGCLSLGLGTRTVHVQESETTQARLASLEHRVNVLEQMVRPVEAGYAVPR